MVNILFAIDKTNIDPNVIEALRRSDRLDFHVVAKKTGNILVDMVIYDESVFPKLKAVLGGIATIIGAWDEDGTQIGQTKTVTYDANGNPIVTITGTAKYPFKTAAYNTFISTGKNIHCWAGWVTRPLV